MLEPFMVHFQENFQSFIEGYRINYEKIANRRRPFSYNKEKGPIEDTCAYALYDIKQQYGSGSIASYTLLGNSMLTIYNYIFNDTIIRPFQLSNNYFEIEYASHGAMTIEENKAGRRVFEAGDLSLSLPRAMEGSLTYRAHEPYQGVSFSLERKTLAAYFGSVGTHMWANAIDGLEPCMRTKRYLGWNAPTKVRDLFTQIIDCRLPPSPRILFYESKIMEIFSFLVANEEDMVQNTSEITLSIYERKVLEKLPQLLMSKSSHLPTLRALSQELAINPKKLTNGFRLMYGDTPYHYHRRHILHYAASQLRDTTRSINDIAHEAGYSTQSNFCIAFRNLYNISPIQYRKASIFTERL